MSPREKRARAVNGALAVLCLGFAALMALALYRVYRYAPIAVDAGYYLPIAERIHDGFVPVRDFPVRYAFLGMYVFAFARFITGIGQSYELYLATLLLVEVAASLLVFQLAKQLTTRFSLRVIAGLSTMAQLLYFEGRFVVLEPFVVVFALAAVLAATTARGAVWRWLLAGALGCLSFWGKQYGILTFVPLFAVLLVTEKSNKSRALAAAWLSLGALVVHACVFGYFASKGVTPRALITDMLGRGAGYLDRSIVTAALAFVKTMVVRTSWLLPLTVYLFVRPDTRKNPVVVASAAGLLAFGATLYVKAFPHYFIQFAPFGVLLMVALIDVVLARFEGDDERSPMLLAATGLVAVSLLVMPAQTAKLIPQNGPGPRAQTVHLAVEVNKVVPPRSQVILLTHPILSMLCDVAPPTLQAVGAQWHQGITRTQLDAGIEAAAFIVYDDRFGNPPAVEIDAGDRQPLQTLSTRGYCERPVVDGGHVHVYANGAHAPGGCPASP